MRRILISTAVVIATASSAFAEEKYTTSELVDFFLNSLDMGATRGICIGTTEDCAPKEAPQGLDMRINFELDSDNLTEDARRDLQTFAAMMSDERLIRARFIVEGHTDARGTTEYNTDLSERRAASVLAALLGDGIAPSRLTAIGRGETMPRTGDAMDAENRRVELRIDLN